MNSSHYLCIAWCWTLNGVDYDVRKFADFSCMCGVESNFDAIISDDLINKSIWWWSGNARLWIIHSTNKKSFILFHSPGSNVRCQGDINIDELKSKLPPGIEIPPSLQNFTLPTIDEIKAVVKSKCDRVAADTAAYEAVEKAAEDFKACASDLIDFEELQKEMEEAQPKGELDTVFNKWANAISLRIPSMIFKHEICLHSFSQILP